MIEITTVTKRYGPKVAVKDLSLSVPAGELFAFLGPNGAGKTTTIKMLCGLLFPTTGTVAVGGFDLATDGDRARALVSYVPDQPFLYDKLTGREFLQFTADLYGMPAAKARDKMAEVIDLFHLDDFVDDLTERYSHGMRQRVVLALALHSAGRTDEALRVAIEAQIDALPRYQRSMRAYAAALTESAD